MNLRYPEVHFKIPTITPSNLMVKLFLISFSLLILIDSCSVKRPVLSSREIDLQFFYDELSPYGYWVHNREYGYVWLPHDGNDFYPYSSKGHWVYTDLGWTWASDYKWGWAVFHYGRWDFDPGYGWFWFPGAEWSPAWVTWRYGNDHLGWAPRTPDSKLGSAGNKDELFRWTFIRETDFGNQKSVRKVDRRGNADVFSRTALLNGGPDPGVISEISGEKIKYLRVTDAPEPDEKIIGEQFRIFRPFVNSSSITDRASPGKITDLKNVLPANERRKKNVTESEVSMYETSLTGQGKSDPGDEKLHTERKRDVERLHKRKEAEHQSRKERISQQQKDQASPDVAKGYQFRKSRRIQKTMKQRQLIEKERIETTEMNRKSIITRIQKKKKQ